jgi:hypothetical protein
LNRHNATAPACPVRLVAPLEHGSDNPKFSSFLLAVTDPVVLDQGGFSALYRLKTAQNAADL